MSEAIRSTLNTRGWLEIEQMFKEKIIESKRNIRTEGRRYEDIAVDTIALKEAGKMVQAVLRELNRMKNTSATTKISYK